MGGERGSLHINAPLSKVAVAFSNEDFIASQILPVIVVPKQSDIYYKYGKDAFYAENDDRANGGESKRAISYSIEGTSSFYCAKHALHDIVTDDDRINADNPISPDIDTVNGLTQKIMLGREIKVADTLFSTTTFSGYTAALSGTDQWDDFTNSDPIGKIETYKETVRAAIGRYPNTLTIGASVFSILKQHPDLLERIKYTQKAILTPELLAELLDLEKVFIGKAIKSTTVKGQDFTGGDVWGKYALLAYLPKDSAPALKKPNLGFIPTWRNNGDLTAKVKKWRVEENDGDKIETEIDYDVIIASAASGYLLSAVIG